MIALCNHNPLSIPSMRWLPNAVLAVVNSAQAECRVAVLCTAFSVHGECYRYNNSSRGTLICAGSLSSH